MYTIKANPPRTSDKSSTMLYVVGGILLVASLAIGITALIYSLKTRDYTTVKNQTINETITNIPKCRQGAAGAQGPPGLTGPQGPPGGMIQYRGVLRNLEYTDLVSDRFFNNAAPYLTKQNYATSQLWTLNSQNFLQNQYRGCMSANPVTGQISMDTCDPSTNPENNKNWSYTAEGQVRLMNTNKCLSVMNQMPAMGTKAIQNGAEPMNLSVKTLPIFSLEDCADSNNIPAKLRWSFL